MGKNSAPTIKFYNKKNYDFGDKKAFPMREQHFFCDVKQAMRDLDWAPKVVLLYVLVPPLARLYPLCPNTNSFSLFFFFFLTLTPISTWRMASKTHNPDPDLNLKSDPSLILPITHLFST